ncbi:MAG: hypothetical protein NCA08_08585 [Deltaproteobacteria bacterium]|nr:hypothetical protein [Candidatus Deferrimicrobium borealis]
MRFLWRVASAASLVLLLCPPARAASPEDHPAVPAILARAESLFQSMKSRDYPAIFAALSAKSRETIVAETSSALAPRKAGAPGEGERRRHAVRAGEDLSTGPRCGPSRFHRGRADRARLLGRLPSPLRPGHRPRA